MLRFVLQLLRSLAVLVTLLLQSWREKRFWFSLDPGQASQRPVATPGVAGLTNTSFNTTPTFSAQTKRRWQRCPVPHRCVQDIPAKSRVYCSLERSIWHLWLARTFLTRSSIPKFWTTLLSKTAS